MNSTAANLARIPMTRRAADFPLNPFLCWVVASVLLAAWWTWFLPLLGMAPGTGFGELFPVALVLTVLLLCLPGRTVAGRLEWARRRAFDTWRNNASKTCFKAVSFAGSMTNAQIAAEKARWNSLRNPLHRHLWLNQWLARDGAASEIATLVGNPANTDTSSVFHAGRVFFALAVVVVVAVLMQPVALLLLLPGGYSYATEVLTVFMRTNTARR